MALTITTAGAMDLSALSANAIFSGCKSAIADFREGEMIEKRWHLMEAWAAYCERPPTSASLLSMVRP
jgi:hypothetical protein